MSFSSLRYTFFRSRRPDSHRLYSSLLRALLPAQQTWYPLLSPVLPHNQNHPYYLRIPGLQEL